MSDRLVGLGGHGETRVLVSPERGGKIVSLLGPAGDREWLAQPVGELGALPAYGSEFTAGDMCGWDEMLPTILACRYPDAGRPAGTPLPDHGEVWALPWQVDRQDTRSLSASVRGRALPYLLERRISVSGPTVRLDYRLSAETSLVLLWAAHPQFACRPETRIQLPSHVARVTDVTPGRPSREAPWPGDGHDLVDRLPTGTGRKFYLPPDAPAAWAALADPDGGRLRLSWDPEQLPYLGVWLDNAGYAREPVVALEPANGYYDDLAHAHSLGRVPTVTPDAPLTWSLTVTLGRSGVSRRTPRAR